MSNVVQFKKAPANKRTRMDTLLVTPEVISEWKLPPWQRPLRTNEKVRAIAEEIKLDAVIPGIITLGVIGSGPDKGTYLVDGQHRIEAFRMSEVKEGLADARIIEDEGLDSLATEFAKLNSQIVRMRPDDMLRAMESSVPAIAVVRDRCPFVGYDNIRRGSTGPVVSMSAIVRLWAGTDGDTPTTITGAAANAAKEISKVGDLCEFLHIVFNAWGRGEDTKRLWSNLNLGLCMWIYRHVVLGPRGGERRDTPIDKERFKKLMFAVGANAEYNDWLLGRQLNDRDRSPAYARLRTIFTKRLKEECVEAPRVIQPAWATNAPGR